MTHYAQSAGLDRARAGRAMLDRPGKRAGVHERRQCFGARIIARSQSIDFHYLSEHKYYNNYSEMSR